MVDNLEWIGKRVRPKPCTGYTGVGIVRGVTARGLAYVELSGFPGHFIPIQIGDLEIVEDEPAQEVSDGG